MRNPLIAAVLACSLLSQSCSADQTTAYLGAVVDALVVADSISRPQDAPILADITSCANAATAEIGSGDSVTVRGTRIALACTAALAKAKGGPVYLQAVAAALSVFLANVQAIQTTAANYMPAQANSFTDQSKSAKLDKGKLAKIKKKLEPLKKKYGK